MSQPLRQRRRSGIGVDESNPELPKGVSPSIGPTVSWSEIPHWQRDNDYILHGYRRVLNSWSGCIASAFTYVHNETINIHSHLIGALLFVFYTATFQHTHIAAHAATATWRDTAVFAIFLSSAVFCLAASALFHAATCHSEGVMKRCHALDYSGIVVLTVGSFYPAIYYGFYCQPVFQAVWLSGITVSGLGAAYIVLSPEYSKPTHRGARTKVFIALGLFAVAPVGQLLTTHGLRTLLQQGFGYLFLSGSLYIGGALIYANRVPERLAPGRYDYVGASHQIFHVCVVAAALAHYSCVLTGYEFWHSGAAVCA